MEIREEKNTLLTLQTWMNKASSSQEYIVGYRPSAFTLIELVIVIFIISLTTALIMPNLWDTGKRAVKSEGKRV